MVVDLLITFTHELIAISVDLEFPNLADFAQMCATKCRKIKLKVILSS